MPSTTGDRIAQRLERTGSSQADLARACGITASAICQWIGSDTKIRPANLVAAADFLGCEIRWLATGEGPEEMGVSANAILATLDEESRECAIRMLTAFAHASTN